MLALIFLILALVCFVLAAAKVPDGYGDRLTPLGLAFFVLSLLVEMRGLG